MFNFSEITYVRPSEKELTSDMKKIIAELGGALTFEDARRAYVQSEKLICTFNTYYTIASIRNSMDTRDQFYEEEMNFFYEVGPRLDLLQKELSETLVASPFKAQFESEFGKDFIKSVEAQIRLADECISEDRVEESKLTQEYQKLTAGCTVQFMGGECNFYGLLKHMLSPDRAVRKAAYLEWAKMYESISGKLDEIFDRLVTLRKQIAKKLNFSSVARMSYLQNGHYYYGAEEVAAFRKQVVEVIVPLAQKLYDEQRARLGIEKLYMYDEELSFPDGNATPIGDKDYMVNCAKEMYEELSKETGEFFNFMVDHGLMDLETRPGKSMGGYCTYISDYNAPFIFSNFNGSSADVDVLTHEAGHAFQAYTAAKHVPLPSLVWSSNDVSEIHSMTMEHFTYPWMEKFFGGNAEKYRQAHLSTALKFIPYICLVDHFQHEVYTHDFTAKERRECWRRLEKTYMPWRQYDGNAFLEGGGYWMQKPHIFCSPFYYIDYALAQMGAFELFSRSLNDRKAAWADYYTLCKLGGSKSYFELLSAANLSNPFEEGTVEKIISTIEIKL